jgi:NAD(P)-dependent dehydrogenase (short-subunit alcohol dehydrogenase family)
MDLQLEGKRAFVSGSTQGIGYAIAKGLACEGVAVVINGRDGARVEDAVEQLRVDVPDADISGVAADYADPDQVAGLTGPLGDVDILVNNVGLFGLAPFEEVLDADWQRYFDVNVMSGVRLSRVVLSGMLARRQGHIIFISSESGINVPADMVHYGVTKAAMIALGNGLAKLTRGTDVTVNTIVGGPTYSDGVAGTVSDIARSQAMSVDDLKAAIIGGNPTSLLQRFIEPDEIARLAVYLASPLSSATNGAALRADGGVLTSMF